MRGERMHPSKKVLIIALAAALAASALMVWTPTSSGEPGGGITIGEVSYSSGTVSFSGSSEDPGMIRFYVTYPDGSQSQYGYAEAKGGSFAGAMKLDLQKGQYSLTVFGSSQDSVSKAFEVSDISISSATYDYDAENLTFAGTSTGTPLRFFVTYPDGSISQYGVVEAEDGKFAGTMRISLPAGEYTLTVFLGSALKDSIAFASTGSSLVSVTVPSPETGLIYNGKAQTGVSPADGYTVTGGSATAAGDHVAKLTLTDGYVWSDGTSGEKSISWSISKAVLTATYVSETVTAGTAPSYAVSVTGFVNGETASTAAGYKAPTVSSASLSVGAHILTPSGGSADNYAFAYVPGTLTVREQSGPQVHTTGISLNKGSTTITAAAGETLTATVTPSNSTDGVSWRSDNNLIVSVDQGGRLTAKAYGKATITATSGSYSASCEVTVAYAPMGISSTTKQMAVGGNETLTITVPSGYSASSAVWRTSDSSTVSFTGTGSTVTISGVKEGSATITAIVGNLYSATCQVTVGPKPVAVNTYTFFLQAPDDAQYARFGSSGYSISDLRSGITLTAEGTDAGSALESALNAEGIPCAFYSGGDLKYWVDQIFGMGDVHLDNGDWQYWIQYHDGAYNDWTLGYYTEGGSFSLIYGITSDPSKTTPIDVPAASTGLVYSGKTQTGVPGGTGYTVAGGSATAPGAYTATITLSDGYTWRDGTTTQKTVSWSISKAVLTATYAGESIVYGTSPSLRVTVTGFVGGETASTASGYAAPMVTATSLSTGSYKLTPSGGAADNYTFRYVSGMLIIEEQVERSDSTNPDGSRTETTTRTNENGTTVTETTTSADGRTTTVVETDPNGDKTTTQTVRNRDGTTDSTTTNPDGSTEATNTSAPVVTNTDDGKMTETSSSTVKSDAGGNVTGYVDSTVAVIEKDDGTKEVSTAETVKDAGGNVTGSTETSETTDRDGNVTGKSETVKDASGRETYSKTEEYVPETVRVEGDAVITESSSRVTERESGTTTVVSESSTETVSAEGWTETETVKEQSVTGTDGRTSSTKTVETVTQDADGDTLKSTSTEAVSADGVRTSERAVEAESADGSVRSGAEVSGGSGSAEILTTVETTSVDGSHALSKDQVEQAISLQEKVSGAISDVTEQTKVIQVESASADASLTVAQDALDAVAESGSSLRTASSAGSLTVPSQVLSNISREEGVTISVSPADGQDMSGVQRDAVADAVAVDVRIMSGDRSLGDQLNGTVTISVRYTPADGKIAVAYYIADDGTRERMGGTYDPARGEVTFGTTHCSIYAIFDEDAEPAGEGGSDNTMLYIGAAIAAVVLIAVAAVLISRRSRTTFP